MRKLIITGLLTLLVGSNAIASMKDVKINELLIYNLDNYIDDYGHRVPWVELYNSGHSTINIASCYLMIEYDDQKIAYNIPKNDSRTLLHPQEYIVFFCEGTGSKGTFHTNFRLDLGQLPSSGDSSLLASANGNPEKWITLSFIDANRRDTIDKVHYNMADQKPDISIGLYPNENGGEEFVTLTSTTPRATNITEEQVPRHEKMRLSDAAGISLTITAMLIVFSALVLLFMAFKISGKVMQKAIKPQKEPTADPSTPPMGELKSGDPLKKGPSAEEIAAIGLALSLYESDLQDQESTVLTINRVAKVYSPWSSKIYGLTQKPNRR